MTHVTIAIASCGRSSLADTLASLDEQTVPEGWAVNVVVADDSRDRSAARIVSRMQMDLPVNVVNVASGNVAMARNACLDAATGEFIAFIDDDEIADFIVEKILGQSKLTSIYRNNAKVQ